MSKVSILDIGIDNVTMKEATKKVEEFVRVGGFHSIYTPNPEIVMIAQEDDEMKAILNEADLVVPDGIGVVIGSRILKTPSLKERVPGYDLVQETMAQAVEKGYKYYFLGSKPGIAQQAKEKMEEKYPEISIVGVRDGYFKEEDIPSILQEINGSKANILLVALGAPKQEKWINKYKDQLPFVRVAIGVGGALDGMAGVVKRAPVIYQKLGLEWFYRLIKQPSRWKRMMLLPLFLVKVLQRR